MKLKKEFIITFLLVSVLSFVPTGEVKANKYSNGHDLEAIYENIKYSGPVYEWDESIVTFQNEGMTVVCSLTIPQTHHLAPIVITLNGFAGDRNDVVIPGTDEPLFKRFARILAE
ncbi:MAG: hypothetical protein JSV88_26655, partial [Candidatus Aminicenantes bacterium]